MEKIKAENETIFMAAKPNYNVVCHVYSDNKLNKQTNISRRR